MALARVRLEALIERLPSIAAQPSGAEALTAMLAEDQRHYSGLSVDEADWLRGHIYAAVALTKDPTLAADPAREDLRTSVSPIVLAGIARAIRAMRAGVQWQADLDAAARRIRFSDIYPQFRFDPQPSCCRPALTCLGELELARADMVQNGDADAEPMSDTPEQLGAHGDAFAAARLQNQFGISTDFDKLADGRPLVLVLFYTRCMNTLKCSLAISRLGRAASRWRDFSFVGMTYDPSFDTPRRLLAYGMARNVEFGRNANLVRCTAGWAELRNALGLRAGYGSATVNTHARELFLVDGLGRLSRLPADWLGDPECLGASFRSPDGFLAPPLDGR